MRKTIILLSTVALVMVPAVVFSTGADEVAAGEPMRITWLGDPAEDTAWQLELEKMFNVDIVPNGVGRYDNEAQRIMVAAGEFPDTGAGTSFDFRLLYRDQVTRSVPETMFRQHALAYSRAMDERFPAVWDWLRVPDKPEEQLGMGSVATGTNGSGVFHQFIRKDWLDNLGVSIPGDYDSDKRLVSPSVYYYEHPDIDLEWVEDVLVAFRDGDADGNGKVDTIPFGVYYEGGGGRPYDSWAWGAIHGALGIPRTNIDRNHIVDGKLYIVLVSPRFKEFTKLAARWWEMGLLDSEWFTLERASHWEKSRTGVFGMVTSNWNYLGRPELPRPPNSLLTDDGAEVIMFAPRGPRGEQFAPMYGTSYLDNQIQMFNKNASDALVAKVLQMQDTKYRLGDGTNEGILMWLNWVPGNGKEGVYWNWSGEPFNSKPVPVDKADLPPGVPKEGGFFTNYPNYAPMERYKITMAPETYSFIADHLFSPRVQRQTFATERVDLFGETEFDRLRERYGETLKTMTIEFFTKGVTGEIDIDAEWDRYVNDWMRAGGDALMAEIEKMPRWEDFFGR